MLLRALTAVILGIVGLVFGMLGTVVHSATIGTCGRSRAARRPVVPDAV